jgi:Ni,Fe-hydrogenase maturation factor
MGLSEKVRAAVDPAIEMIESLIREILNGADNRATIDSPT